MSYKACCMTYRSLRISAHDFQSWQDSRLMAHYQAIKPWCEFVLNQHIPMAVQGDWRGLSLLFPMEKLFESYVAC